LGSVQSQDETTADIRCTCYYVRGLKKLASTYNS